MADFDFSTLITDRSPEDLQALRDLLATPMADWTAEQLAEFNQAVSKGAYNYTDLNRVTACMDYLNERLTALGYVTGYRPIIVHPETPSPTPTLPEGYTELEYIQSSGTQYVDTGFKPNQDTSVSVEFETSFVDNTTASTHPVYGSATDYNSSAFEFWTVSKGFYTYGSQNWQSDFGIVANAKYESLQEKNVVSLNDVTKSFEYQTFETPYNLLLFATRRSSGIFIAQSDAQLKIYSCKIYDDDTLVRNYVPCKNPDGEVGLYDLVGKQFYGNAGTGVFIAGPEVTPSIPTLDPYTWHEGDIPTASQMQRYLANVAALRGVLSLPQTIPVVPRDMVGLTQREANTIESILGLIQAYLVAMQQVVFQSGMVWAVSGGPGWYFGQ